ncbi:HD domain-containing protein [Acetobacter oeni]|uniref:Phosphohydrolase n=1 Tax=Acetobacter oeni TaxID=304077 RepID=A0A511XNC4_9PROT|nr:HD domain-containing protein [Acetobacter oeni]MBB3883285.1 GTP pyrophosphokinase [Acetobacter oeni]NHO19350.1 HD domain-containing protein [Acetobacter oeni]GBR10172.1 metal dependent phosphohydrolase [Acetobacter oeni LMG 21952]GEN64444.1 hypothetical protein AOE01nite_26680 [Acetobacter oeni]
MPDQKRWTRLTDALGWAIALHGEQERKGAGTPYIAHLLAVTGLVLEYGGDEDQAIAAALHDAIEDQGITRQMIADRFGSRVADIVQGCTDAETLPKPPWRERKETYIAALEHKNSDTLFVSCADKLHNVRTIIADYHQVDDDVFTRFRGGKDGTLWYYTALADVYARRLPGTLAAELSFAVKTLQEACTRSGTA